MNPIRPEDVAKLFKKPAEKRYEYFIKTVADTEAVFGLIDEEGWALLGEDDDPTDILPVFPHAEMAEQFKVEHEFEDFEIGEIDVNEFLEWLGEMESETTEVAVFPDLSMSGLVVAPDKLIQDLQTELAKYDEDGKKINK